MLADFLCEVFSLAAVSRTLGSVRQLRSLPLQQLTMFTAYCQLPTGNSTPLCVWEWQTDE